jgi:hypothetical protein
MLKMIKLLLQSFIGIRKQISNTWGAFRAFYIGYFLCFFYVVLFVSIKNFTMLKLGIDDVSPYLIKLTEIAIYINSYIILQSVWMSFQNKKNSISNAVHFFIFISIWGLCVFLGVV